jgi:hypothetical protein
VGQRLRPVRGAGARVERTARGVLEAVPWPQALLLICVSAGVVWYALGRARVLPRTFSDELLHERGRAWGCGVRQLGGTWLWARLRHCRRIRLLADGRRGVGLPLDPALERHCDAECGAACLLLGSSCDLTWCSARGGRADGERPVDDVLGHDHDRGGVLPGLSRIRTGIGACSRASVLGPSGSAAGGARARLRNPHAGGLPRRRDCVGGRYLRLESP